MRFQAREFLYLPNLLTYLRILLIPVIYHLLREDQLAWPAILGAFLMATDILDGILARRLNQISELGKILDPLSDKIAIAIFAIYAVIHRDFPLWAAALIIGRDVLIILLVPIFAGKTNQIPVSNFLGKITALSWGILLTVYVLDWEPIKPIWLLLSVILLGASGFSYGRKLIMNLKP